MFAGGLCTISPKRCQHVVSCSTVRSTLDSLVYQRLQVRQRNFEQNLGAAAYSESAAIRRGRGSRPLLWISNEPFRGFQTVVVNVAPGWGPCPREYCGSYFSGIVMTCFAECHSTGLGNLAKGASLLAILMKGCCVSPRHLQQARIRAASGPYHACSHSATRAALVTCH